MHWAEWLFSLIFKDTSYFLIWKKGAWSDGESLLYLIVSFAYHYRSCSRYPLHSYLGSGRSAPGKVFSSFARIFPFFPFVCRTLLFLKWCFFRICFFPSFFWFWAGLQKDTSTRMLSTVLDKWGRNGWNGAV